MELTNFIKHAFKEDMPNGDITTNALIPSTQKTEARLIAKESGVIAGILEFKKCFKHIDAKIKFKKFIKDGSKVKKGDLIGIISGSTRSILKAERVSLNILQRMSGIATLSSKFAVKVKNTNAKVYDTRKTTPNFRFFEKKAVKIGGCENHRNSLSDMAMIKDNHINAVGSIESAIKKMKSKTKKKVLVEVETMHEFRQAVKANPDIIMLDNMSLANMKKCVKENKSNIKLEATGNVTLDTVLNIAKTGVDRISTGQMTHSYKSLDISLKF